MPGSSASASSSSSSRRNSTSDQSSTSTFYSPTIITSTSFKPSSSTSSRNHSRNSSRTINNTHTPKLFNISNAFTDIDSSRNEELDPEKGENVSSSLPRSPSLENVNPLLTFPSPFSPLSSTKNPHHHLHIGLRRRRLLSQALALFSFLILGGWFLLNQRENGLISGVIGTKSNWSNGISTESEPILPGVIIGSNGQIHSSHSSSVDITAEGEDVQPMKEQTYEEKMAEITRIKPQEWGLNLSPSNLLGGLRKFPSNADVLGGESKMNSMKALSSLGKFADDIYLLGPITKKSYFEQMREFSNMVFPPEISKKLVEGLRSYMVDGDGALEDSDDLALIGLPSGSGSTSKQSWDIIKKIWQTDKNKQKENTKEVKSWKDGRATDEGWEWDLLTDKDADAYVNKKLAGSRFKEIWDNLPSGILRSDTLRYLLVLLEGGIYTDTDTSLLKPPSSWGKNPKLYKNGVGWLTDSQIQRIQGGEDVDDIIGRPSVIVGLEADVGDREDWYDWWPRPIQIVQWTITSTPHHPIALNALLRIYHSTVKAVEWSHSNAYSVKVLKDQGRYEDAKKLSQVNVLNEPKNGGPVGVMAWTGPGVWTDAVLSYLRMKYGLIWTDLKDLREPLRIGDVVILPVTGFSPGVGNFGAQMASHEQAMVEHNFAGSWKPKEGEEDGNSINGGSVEYW